MRNFRVHLKHLFQIPPVARSPIKNTDQFENNLSKITFDFLRAILRNNHFITHAHRRGCISPGERSFAQGLWTRGKDSRILSRVDWKLIGARPREHDEYRIVRKSRNDVPLCLKDELCANNVSNIPSFIGSRSIESSISMLSLLPTRNTILLEGFENRPMFHRFYYFLHQLRNFCWFTTERARLWFVLRPDNLAVWTSFLNLDFKKKKKKSENDEIWSARRKVDSCCWSRWTSLRFALICTKVKLSKGRGNWNSIESVNKEREILYQIFFKGVRLEDYQIYRSKRREWL